MNRPTTAENDGPGTERRKPKRLSREARGLVFVYALFALVSGALAYQCVERPDTSAPPVAEPATGR